MIAAVWKENTRLLFLIEENHCGYKNAFLLRDVNFPFLLSVLTWVPDENSHPKTRNTSIHRIVSFQVVSDFQTPSGYPLTTCHQSSVWSSVEEGKLFRPVDCWTIGMVVLTWLVTCYSPWTPWNLSAPIVSLRCLPFLESAAGDLEMLFWRLIWGPAIHITPRF